MDPNDVTRRRVPPTNSSRPGRGTPPPTPWWNNLLKLLAAFLCAGFLVAAAVWMLVLPRGTQQNQGTQASTDGNGPAATGLPAPGPDGSVPGGDRSVAGGAGVTAPPPGTVPPGGVPGAAPPGSVPGTVPLPGSGPGASGAAGAGGAAPGVTIGALPPAWGRTGRSGVASAVTQLVAGQRWPRRRRRRCAVRRAELVLFRRGLPARPRGPIAAETQILEQQFSNLRPPDLQIFPVGASPDSVAAALSQLDVPICVTTNPALADAVAVFAGPGLSAAGVGGAAASTASVAAAASALPGVLTSAAGGLLGGLGGLGTAVATSAASGIVGSTVADAIVGSDPTPGYLGTAEPGFVDETIPNERDLSASVTGARAASTARVASAVRVGQGRDTSFRPAELRVNPMFAIIGRGTRREFKVEAKGNDGRWHDVTRDAQVSFANPTGTFVQHRAARNVLAVPINTSPLRDGSRSTIQAEYRAPGGRRLEAKAVAIASMYE